MAWLVLLRGSMETLGSLLPKCLLVGVPKGVRLEFGGPGCVGSRWRWHCRGRGLGGVGGGLSVPGSGPLEVDRGVTRSFHNPLVGEVVEWGEVSLLVFKCPLLVWWCGHGVSWLAGVQLPDQLGGCFDHMLLGWFGGSPHVRRAEERIRVSDKLVALIVEAGECGIWLDGSLGCSEGCTGMTADGLLQRREGRVWLDWACSRHGGYSPVPGHLHRWAHRGELKGRGGYGGGLGQHGVVDQLGIGDSRDEVSGIWVEFHRNRSGCSGQVELERLDSKGLWCVVVVGSGGRQKQTLKWKWYNG